MKFLVFAFRIIYNIYALICFLATMFLILPFVIICSFFGRINGGNMVYKICCIWADVWFFLIGIFHRNIYDSPHDKSQQYIFVANHNSYLDAPVIVKTLRQPVRVLGKVEMARVPVFGFIYKNAIVTVDRSSAENRGKSVRILKSVLHKGISIFLFPEGTFNETEYVLKDFYDGAFRIAIETQTPIKPLLFVNAYNRMPYPGFFSLTPGRSRSVYLQEIPVTGLRLKDVQYLKDKVWELMEKKLIEYKVGSLRGEEVKSKK